MFEDYAHKYSNGIAAEDYAQLDTGLMTFAIKTCDIYTRAMLDCGSTRERHGIGPKTGCGHAALKLTVDTIALVILNFLSTR